MYSCSCCCESMCNGWYVFQLQYALTSFTSTTVSVRQQLVSMVPLIGSLVRWPLTPALSSLVQILAAVATLGTASIFLFVLMVTDEAKPVLLQHNIPSSLVPLISLQTPDTMLANICMCISECSKDGVFIMVIIIC